MKLHASLKIYIHTSRLKRKVLISLLISRFESDTSQPPFMLLSLLIGMNGSIRDFYLLATFLSLGEHALVWFSCGERERFHIQDIHYMIFMGARFSPISSWMFGKSYIYEDPQIARRGSMRAKQHGIWCWSIVQFECACSFWLVSPRKTLAVLASKEKWWNHKELLDKDKFDLYTQRIY